MFDININFDIAKIKHNIDRHGTTYTFKRETLNEFKEPTGEIRTVAALKGLFHQVRGYIDKSTTDGTIRRSKPQPAILVLAEGSAFEIQLNDFIEVKGYKYTVTGTNNINNLDIAIDISLELVDNGV